MIHYRKMTKNYIFRKFECELSKEDAAELCFKSVRTITSWDNGKEIPKECKRLMRMFKCRQLSHDDSWNGFRMVKNKLELPTGQKVSAQQLLTAVAVLSIESELELKISTKLLKFAREIELIKNK